MSWTSSGTSFEVIGPLKRVSAARAMVLPDCGSAFGERLVHPAVQIGGVAFVRNVHRVRDFNGYRPRPLAVRHASSWREVAIPKTRAGDGRRAVAHDLGLPTRWRDES